MLKPKPPTEIPTSDPVIVPHPTPRLPFAMWQEKPLWKSRTLLSLAVAVGALVLGFFGIEGIDLAVVAEDNVLTLGEAVTVVFAIAAAVFRVKATGPLTVKPSTD